MSAKHTPGPWVWDGEGRIDALKFRKVSPRLVGGRPYMEGLVALPYSCGGHATREANARLMAAAPELLVALEAAESVMSHPVHAFEVLAEHSVVREMIRAAIAKATGAT